MADEAADDLRTPQLGEAVAVLADFLGAEPLTAAITSLERSLVGRPASQIGDLAAARGINPDLMVAALTVRESLGRLNDLIHAAGIVLALPHLLDDGEEIVVRPSLAAGNDPRRPFDLETDRRVAEFKLARWPGADAMRKRQTFKDLVMLAADRTGRRAELFVVGPEPGRFLRTSRATAAWALDRAPHARRVFEESFGSLDVSVAQFTERHAGHVQVTDLREVLPPTSTYATESSSSDSAAPATAAPPPGSRCTSAWSAG
ncbi:PE-PGRS family protein [Streptomyces fungicidicus]|uniref:PE-PGRS family protein n=1 Tax=Streptomyces fungicidicus TaxID=68203 RepID=UPI0036CF30F1